MDEAKNECKHNKNYSNTASGGAVYGIGMIGALVYFISNASGLSEGLIGVFKSLVWPAYMVYYAFQALLK